LSGNVRQWIVSAIGGAADIRRRDDEFAARGDWTAGTLARTLTSTVQEAATVLERLAPERVTGRIRVQNFDLTILEAVYHVVEHFSYHTGQIIFATKLMTGSDLGYYRHLTAPAHVDPTP
jgi:uncharacterized damage-inducible protein DinB